MSDLRSELERFSRAFEPTRAPEEAPRDETDEQYISRLIAAYPQAPGCSVFQLGSEPCCPRAGEYNGFASGPLLFRCPRSCSCHD